MRPQMRTHGMGQVNGTFCICCVISLDCIESSNIITRRSWSWDVEVNEGNLHDTRVQTKAMLTDIPFLHASASGLQQAAFL